MTRLQQFPLHPPAGNSTVYPVNSAGYPKITSSLHINRGDSTVYTVNSHEHPKIAGFVHTNRGDSTVYTVDSAGYLKIAGFVYRVADLGAVERLNTKLPQFAATNPPPFPLSWRTLYGHSQAAH